MRFTIKCVPPITTFQQKKLGTVGGKPRMFRSKAVRETEATLAALLLPHQPTEPVPGPVFLSITVVWPWRVSEPKKRRALRHAYHTTRPDLDNWLKGFIDALARLRFIEDDKAVASIMAAKFWGDAPSISVTIASLDEENPPTP